jgi:Skp family chaperone for outer membrane proteins
LILTRLIRMWRCGNGSHLRIFRLEAAWSITMNRPSLIAAVVLAAAFSGSQVFAQGSATQPRPQVPAAQPSVANVPVSKVAVIFSVDFQDPKTGIARFTVTLTKLNSEFQKTQDELNQTAQKLKTLQDEINNLQRSPNTTPAQIQAKIAGLDQQKKEYTRKGEDAQALYQKRRQELFLPFQDDVGKALDAFAKARNVTMVLDGSQVQGILYAAEASDITRAFINDYNTKNPATASATPPK